MGIWLFWYLRNIVVKIIKILRKQTQSMDGEGHATVAAYDSQSRLVTATNALGHAYRYEYNAYGDIVSQTTPTGNRHALDYDSLGRVASYKNPAGDSSQYDQRGVAPPSSARHATAKA